MLVSSWPVVFVAVLVLTTWLLWECTNVAEQPMPLWAMAPRMPWLTWLAGLSFTCAHVWVAWFAGIRYLWQGDEPGATARLDGRALLLTATIGINYIPSSLIPLCA